MMHIRPWSLGCAEVEAAAEELLHSPLMMTQSTFIHEPVSFLTRLIPVAFSQIIVAAQDFLGSYANNQASVSAADVGRHHMAAPLAAARRRKWESPTFAALQQRIISKQTLNNSPLGFLFISQRMRHFRGRARTK